MKVAFRAARFVAASAAMTMLVSCGGGGGGGSGGGSVNTSQASVTASNVQAFVGDSVAAMAFAITARIGPGTTSPQTGIAGGNVTFSLTTGVGGNITGGTGTYAGLNRAAGVTLSGDITVTSGTINGSLFDNLHFTSSGLSSGNLVLSGTVDLQWKASMFGSAGYVMTINATVRNGAGDTVAILENFAVDSDIAAGQETIQLTGKLTDAAQGFVDVSTVTPMVFPLPGTAPTSGQYVVTGTTTKATITFSGGTATAVISPI